MDPEYEAEEMETNLESMFEHVNQMSNTDMPRDFLASLSKYFFRESGEKFTAFQKFHTEACLLLEQRRPHWRKRKGKSASQFVSLFYLLENEVMKSGDQVAMRLFVEAFNSREAYIESVMEEFDETDKLENIMSSGPEIRVPGFVYDDNGDIETVENADNHEFDYNNCILEVCDIIENLDDINITKYVKLFEKDNDASVAIHIARIKALAKRNSKNLTPFPPVKSYPTQVKSSTKTFTKLTSSESVGASNTSAGYCMLINVKHMSEEAKIRILDVLGREDLFGEAHDEEHGGSGLEDDDLLPSQDFPNLFQSQTSETLLHCTLCEYLSRSKVEFEEHAGSHPKCKICRKQVQTESLLNTHMELNHPKTDVSCNKCSKAFPNGVELGHHLKEHEMFSSYQKALERNTKATPKPKSKAAPKVAKKKKVMNCYLIFIDEHRAKAKEDNPTLTPNAITKLLSEAWNKLTKEEQKEYKVKAAQMNAEDAEDFPCPKCGDKCVSNSDLIKHLMTQHIDAASSVTQASSSNSSDLNSVGDNQSRIHKCNICGKMYFNMDKLNEHKATTHNTQENPTQEEEPMEGDAVEVTDDGNINAEEELGTRLVWVKLANQPWPAKLISNEGEVSEVELFDEEGTRKMIEHIKLKPFSRLNKIPRRSNLWKAAYTRALQCFKV